MLLSIVLTGATSSARADDPVPDPEIIPACIVYQVPGIGQVCGYADIADVRAVYTADADLVASRALLTLERRKTEAMERAAGLHGEQLAACDRLSGALSVREKELTAALIDENRKLERERAKPRFGNPIAWTVAAASVAVLLGYVAADRLN